MHAAKSARSRRSRTSSRNNPASYPRGDRGARRDAIPRTPTSIAGSTLPRLREAARRRRCGVRNIKIAPFDGVIAEDAASTPIDERTKAGLDRVYAVRDAIGPDRALMVDCRRFDEPRAIALIRDIARRPVLGRMSDFRASVAIWRDRATTGSRM